MNIRVNQIQRLYIFRWHCFMLTCPIWMSVTLINTKTHKPTAWYGFDEWSDWAYCAPFKIPRMFGRSLCKSILSLFYFTGADSTYFLAVVLSIDWCRGLEETRRGCDVCVWLFRMSLVFHLGLSVVLVCLGKFSWQTPCILCFITPPAAGSLYIALPVKSRITFLCVLGSGSFRYWLMSNEIAFSYYRMKILIWEMLSEKKGAFIMLPVCSIIS